MVERGVARKLSEREMMDWPGAVFYISHLAVQNPKSESTPVRIVFNYSQKCEGISLNDALAKGPYSYLNSLLGILLRWREGHAVVIGDIKKMFNSIEISEADQHCHRFLWRDIDITREPDTYVITRVNMGDRPAPAISTEAILKTADMFQTTYPHVKRLLYHSTYVDDIIKSTMHIDEAKALARDTELVLSKCGFIIKGWLFHNPSDDESHSQTRVLGVEWNSATDAKTYDVSVNIPLQMTRRNVLEQVMRIYDPMGILSPFVLNGKILLRRTWELKLGWDDPLPMELRGEWHKFLTDMHILQQYDFNRCLTPKDASGQPSLVLLSDASEKAYGYAAYVRWKLTDGSYWCRLIMAKTKIAPMETLTTPRLELNVEGAQ